MFTPRRANAAGLPPQGDQVRLCAKGGLIMLEAGDRTGRISQPLHALARSILFDRELDEQIDQDLGFITRIDQAHVLMLAEQSIVPANVAARLLRAITKIRGENFEPLRHRQPYRGLFLLYESYLIETEGEAIGGVLQTGRSRNDLNAALLRIRIRRPYLDLVRSALQLYRAVLTQAAEHLQTVMPAYTHGQAAEPITYGHYLAGVAEAIFRDIESLINAARDLDTCPLGAGAVAGSSLPINTRRTAVLLGFSHSAANSIDAVASRDFVLRLLSSMVIYGTTMSRVATDLLQWVSAEFGFLSLPDDLVGSSSAMPQKRNPFLLEHVQGRSASAVGILTSAVAATRNTSFTNSISVGTESIRGLWGACRDITDVSILLRLVLEGARPCPQRMLERAKDSFANATAAALQLVTEQGIDFRSAHSIVGRAVSAAIDKGLRSLDVLELDDGIVPLPLAVVDVTSCVHRAEQGGGPAPRQVSARLAVLDRCAMELSSQVSAQAARWTEAEQRLDQAIKSYCDDRVEV